VYVEISGFYLVKILSLSLSLLTGIQDSCIWSSLRNKLKFVSGSLPKPHAFDPTFNAWEHCNNLVLSWILNSIETYYFAKHSLDWSWRCSMEIVERSFWSSRSSQSQRVNSTLLAS